MSIKVIMCNVNKVGFGGEDKNNERIVQLKKVFEYAKKEKVQLVCMPAGFLTLNFKNQNKLKNFIKKLLMK